MGGYQSRILSCIVRHRYQASTSKDTEDIVFAVVIFGMRRLMNVL